MARLSRPFGLREVQGQFGQTNRPISLRGMAVRIYGGNVSGRKLSDFDNKGAPFFTGTPTTTVGANNINVTFNFDSGGIDAEVRVEYSKDVGFDSSDYTSFQTFTTGSRSIDVTGLDVNTVYFLRLEARNGFNDQHVDDYTRTQSFTAETIQDKLNTPAVIGVTNYDSLFNRYTLQWTISGVQPTGYVGEFRVNGGAWESVGVAEPFSHWSSSSISPKTGIIQASSLPNPNDFYEFRIRGTRSGYTISDWSNIVGFQH